MNEEKVAGKVADSYQVGGTPLHFTIGFAPLARDIGEQMEKVVKSAKFSLNELKTVDLTDEKANRGAVLGLSMLERRLEMAAEEIARYRGIVERMQPYVKGMVVRG